jgi:dihydropteroate synthase
MERRSGLVTIPLMVNLSGLAGSPAADRCLVMGVVNVTPDSFSDGGQWFGAAAAIEHGLELIAQGADIIDVGGESTRPGAQRIPADEELRRVKPVITELVRAGAVVSVDTMRAQVAEWAVEAGVSLVNDVSGGLADPYMPRLVGKAGVPYVVMHWRGHSHDMYSRAIYADVVREVHDELARRIDAVAAEGVDPSMIVLDPGLGFSKNPAARGPEAHNWQLLAGLAELATIGGRDFPVLVGASRKRYLSRLSYPRGGQSSGMGGSRPPCPLAPVPPAVRADGPDRKDRDGIRPAHPDEDRERRPYSENDDATAAITALVAAAGAWCVRVHQVPANADAVRVAAAYRAAGRS